MEQRRLDRRLAVAEECLVRCRDRLAEIEAGLGYSGGTQALPRARFDVERAELLLAELNERLRVLLAE